MKTTLIIGENAEVCSYKTTQQGYGRQHLSIEIRRLDMPHNPERRYIQDALGITVYPNLLEHYQHAYYVLNYANYDEERGIWTRDSGEGEYTEDCIFENDIELLNHVLKGREIEVEDEDDETLYLYQVRNFGMDERHVIITIKEADNYDEATNLGKIEISEDNEVETVFYHNNNLKSLKKY